jgi:hypothetical protein
LTNTWEDYMKIKNTLRAAAVAVCILALPVAAMANKDAKHRHHHHHKGMHKHCTGEMHGKKDMKHCNPAPKKEGHSSDYSNLNK